MVWADDGTWVDTPADDWAGPQPVQAAAPPEPPRLLPGETWPQWGARTGRYSADRIAFWEGEMAKERNRVMASGGDRTKSAVAATIVSLYPALAPGEVLGEPVDDSGLARRVLASAGLDPYSGRRVYAAGTSTATGYRFGPDGKIEPRSRIEALDWATKGKPREIRYAEEDAQLEAALAEAEERDRLLASSGLTEDEYLRLFPGEH